MALVLQFEAYKEEQLPIIRKEQPGMRLQQCTFISRASGPKANAVLSRRKCSSKNLFTVARHQPTDSPPSPSQYKQFQKSELNPFNQVTLAYDSTKDDKVAALAKVREETARRCAFPVATYVRSNR